MIRFQYIVLKVFSVEIGKYISYIFGIQNNECH